jgi:hypothetical protein
VEYQAQNIDENVEKIKPRYIFKCLFCYNINEKWAKHVKKCKILRRNAKIVHNLLHTLLGWQHLFKQTFACNV